MSINLARLRRDAPEYMWRAERYGFGWLYYGDPKEWTGRGTVKVQNYSVLCGPLEDDFLSEPYVTTREDNMIPYSLWLFTRHHDTAPTF